MAAPSPLRRGLALVGLVLLAGCGQAFRPSAPVDRNGAPLRVVTTVLPMGLLTQAVAGSCAQVEALLPASADLHDLPVSPQLVGRLRGADVLVFNGLGLEAPLEQLLAGADGPRPQTIVAAAGLDPLPATAHDHDHDSGHGHGAAHSQEKGANAARSPGTAGASVNPHVWLDPRRAAGQVRAIRDGLATADPPRAACFRRNAALFLSDLERLDRDLARQLAPYAGRPILSFHDLAPYFAQRYGLRAESVVDLPEENPSVADLRRVVGELRRQRLRGLLVDPQNERPSFQALAADLDLVLLPFDPIERADEVQARRPSHYLEAMRRNGASVVESLRSAGEDPPDLR
jgi:zinc/manganese transport system substrate-binding protein